MAANDMASKLTCVGGCVSGCTTFDSKHVLPGCLPNGLDGGGHVPDERMLLRAFGAAEQPTARRESCMWT